MTGFVSYPIVTQDEFRFSRRGTTFQDVLSSFITSLHLPSRLSTHQTPSLLQYANKYYTPSGTLAPSIHARDPTVMRLWVCTKKLFYNIINTISTVTPISHCESFFDDSKMHIIFMYKHIVLEKVLTHHFYTNLSLHWRFHSNTP